EAAEERATLPATGEVGRDESREREEGENYHGLRGRAPTRRRRAAGRSLLVIRSTGARLTVRTAEPLLSIRATRASSMPARTRVRSSRARQAVAPGRRPAMGSR